LTECSFWITFSLFLVSQLKKPHSK